MVHEQKIRVTFMEYAPPGVAALIGEKLSARDRAAFSTASRLFAAAHHTVVEEDAWPALGPPHHVSAERARSRVAQLVRAMPALRTLRVDMEQHEAARAFLAMGGGRTTRFECIFNADGNSAELVFEFPGRVSVDFVPFNAMLRLAEAPSYVVGMVRMLGQLASVGCLNLKASEPLRFHHDDDDKSLIDRNVRRLVAELPWPVIRTVRLSCTQADETVALLASIPAEIASLSLRVAATGFDRLAGVLAAIEGRPDLLDRVADVRVDDGGWGVHSVESVFEAMSTIAVLPAACSVSFSDELCRNALAVPLLREALASDGGRRDVVKIVCSTKPGAAAAALEICPFVQAVVACVGAADGRLSVVDSHGLAIDAQPDGDRTAALERLRADPQTAGVAALWRRMAGDPLDKMWDDSNLGNMWDDSADSNLGTGSFYGWVAHRPPMK